jgi:hypothetical protein
MESVMRDEDIDRDHWEMEQSPHGYWRWVREIGDRDEPSTVVIFARSPDEHAEQNVNWETTDYFGWSMGKKGRGHARTVRAAMRKLEEK